jgi:hypothetical protein
MVLVINNAWMLVAKHGKKVPGFVKQHKLMPTNNVRALKPPN